MVSVVGDGLHGFLLMCDEGRLCPPILHLSMEMRRKCGRIVVFFADFALILKQKFNLQIGAEKCFMAMFGGSPFLTLGVLQ